MAYRHTPFAPGEWYHCYTRSIDGRPVFKSRTDYQRFQQGLYMCNGTVTTERGTLYKPVHADFFTIERGKPLVAVGAYCLMPTHFHLLIKENSEGGISKFMQRIGTGFTNYFNVKHHHIGNVFIKPFRSKHIKDDRYFKRVAQYIHLNPAELCEPNWKLGEVRNIRTLKNFVEKYEYSSLQDRLKTGRVESAIINNSDKDLFRDMPPLVEVLSEAATYYQELSGMPIYRSDASIV